MITTPAKVTQTYYLLTLLSTLAASFIWGINTLFLLDAGLSNAEAFAANAFFTAGQVLFEVPTGVIADTRGRRLSYALGAGTLLVTTLAYFWLWQIHGPFWAWAVVSALLGLGFTFFSGATEAWLVDALKATGYEGKLETVFARAQSIGGGAMLVGSIGGGLIAQATNLGVPYLLRAALLVATLVVSLVMMKDLGFTPRKGQSPLGETKLVLAAASEYGWHSRPVRWLMTSSLFTTGVGFYLFYAAQPFLLELYGDSTAYGIAGLAAAIVAGSQIAGGLLVGIATRLVPNKTLFMVVTLVLGVVATALIGLAHNFWLALALLVVWGLIGALARPVRQVYLNDLLPSSERATLLSFDSLVGSSGGVVAQPVLGRVADVFGYGASFMVGGLIQLAALPFLLLVHRGHRSTNKH